MSTTLSGGCFSFNLNFNNFSVDDHVCTQNNLVSTDLLCFGYGTGRCTQCGQDWFILSCPTKQDTSARKRSWVQIQKDRLKLAFVVNTTCGDKLKHVFICKSLHPRCFGRWFPTYYVWWYANQMAWMTPNVFKGWMMSLNVRFISQKGTFYYATHFSKSFGFSTLQLSNIIITLLPPIITSVVQPLDHRIIASFSSI